MSSVSIDGLVIRISGRFLIQPGTMKLSLDARKGVSQANKV